MSNYQSVFERKEIKYVISYQKWKNLLHELEPFMKLDKYGKHLITNIYYDTQTWYLIRHSMSRPVYKEKVRLRSYGVPTEREQVFMELKKKYKGVVYKRRTDLRLNQAERFLAHEPVTAAHINRQIMHEFEAVLNTYPDLKPAMYLSYERMAYVGKEDDSVRITFDQDILYRTDDLSLMAGSYGESILQQNELLMEIKISGGMPIWLANILSENQIFPSKFSKYANAYKKYLEKQSSTPIKKNEKEVYSA